ncbi:MAG: SH3 domain-containing protein [Anaerolineales bacterium]|nr:SH3 domain-containing protein [Anaerolineales bacterium]
MMVEKKLRHGDKRLQNAGGDKEQYAYALLAYHGALEDFFRQRLASEITELEKTLNGRKAGWLDLINLWEKRYSLSYSEKKTILDHNTIRQPIGHGDLVEVERTIVERYGNFVKEFIGRHSPSGQRLTPPSQSSPSVISSTPPAPSKPPTQKLTPPSQPSPSVIPSTPLAPSKPSTVDEPPVIRSKRISTLALIALVFALGIIYISLNVWNEWEISAGITAVLFFLLYRRQIWGSIYVYIAGLAYGYLTTILGILSTTATGMALIWPLYVGRFYLANDSTNVVQFLNLEAQTTTAFIETWLPSSGAASSERETKPTVKTTATPVQSTTIDHTLQIQVQGNSRVRAEPNETAEMIGIALDGIIYDVLDTAPGKSWYKIRLESGQEGWIGSTRIVEITP